VLVYLAAYLGFTQYIIASFKMPGHPKWNDSSFSSVACEWISMGMCLKRLFSNKGLKRMGAWSPTVGQMPYV